MVEIKSKNEIIESLKDKNGPLIREIAQQMHFQNELKSKLIQKEIEICDFENKVESILLQKEKKLYV